MTHHRGIAVVIEDDHDMSALVAQVLAQQGLEVVTVDSGPRGVEAVRLNVPLVTTVDLGVPGLDGIEVVREIRTFSSTYVIVVTGRTDEADVLEALTAGADAYLTKPVRPRELRARVEAVIRRASPELLAEAAAQRRIEVPEQLPEPTMVGAPRPEAAAPEVEAPPKAVWTASARREAPRPETPAAIVDPEPTPVAPTTATPAPDRIRVWARSSGQPHGTAAEPQATWAQPYDQHYERAYDEAQPPHQGDPALWSAQPTQPAQPPQPTQPAPPSGEWEVHDGLAVNRGLGAVEVDGHPVPLDPAEWGVLIALLDSGRRVRSRAELALVILGDTGDPSAHMGPAARQLTDTVVASLVTKLGEDPARPRWIETVPGVGYRRPRG